MLNVLLLLLIGVAVGVVVKDKLVLAKDLVVQKAKDLLTKLKNMVGMK